MTQTSPLTETPAVTPETTPAVVPTAPTNGASGSNDSTEVLKHIDQIAVTLGTAIAGDFDFVVRTESQHHEVQRLVLMSNFLLETVREAIADRDVQRQRELEKMVAELRQAMQFKDQFLATMSHELRTPLNAVIGYAGIGLSEDFDSEAERLFDRIRVNAKRLLTLINDVLDISRLNARRVEILSVPVALHELIQGWHDEFKPRAAEKNLAFTLELDPAVPENVQHDPDRLTQIVHNLLNNAFKFTDKGSVKMTVKALENKQMQISVTDTGAGIPETWQHIIFDEFRQVDGSSARKHGGSGLGLAIVQKLCVLMGGSIHVQSKVGEGSTFIVTLPFHTVPHAAPSASTLA